MTAAAAEGGDGDEYSDEDDDDDDDSEEEEEEMKMVLIVRTDLKMSPGKVAAQCVHAALGAVRICSVESANSLNYWEECGEATICLKCESDEEMIVLEILAKEKEIETGSKTVLAIGPAFRSKIDEVTGKLKLYR